MAILSLLAITDTLKLHSDLSLLLKSLVAVLYPTLFRL